MNEVQLYNLYGRLDSSSQSATDAQTLALMLMIKHLRIEHGMSLRDIAKRCGLTVKKVKAILGVES